MELKVAYVGENGFEVPHNPHRFAVGLKGPGCDAFPLHATLDFTRSSRSNLPEK